MCVLKSDAECPRDVPDESDDEWLEEVETAVAPEGEKMEVEAEAGKKDHKKMDTAERDVRNEWN
jgi:hypothetical protein